MLQEMINKYVPGYYNRPLSQQHVDKYRSAVFGGPVQVYRIDPQHITAKENPIALGRCSILRKSHIHSIGFQKLVHQITASTANSSQICSFGIKMD